MLVWVVPAAELLNVKVPSAFNVTTCPAVGATRPLVRIKVNGGLVCAEPAVAVKVVPSNASPEPITAPATLLPLRVTRI